MEYDVALVVGIGLDKLIEFDAVGRNQRIFNSVSKEASATQKLEFESVIVIAQADSDAHCRFRLLQFHAVQVNGNIKETISIHIPIFCRRFLPNDNFVLCLTAHDAEQSQDSQ